MTTMTTPGGKFGGFSDCQTDNLYAAVYSCFIGGNDDKNDFVGWILTVVFPQEFSEMPAKRPPFAA